MMHRKTDQKGQSLVEVAIALPLLILILMGILDLGRAYFTFIALSDAAAEGAAYAAIHPENTAQITARAADNTNGFVVLEPEMVSVDCNDFTAGSPITVSVTFDYQLLTPIVGTLIPDSRITMHATVVQSIVSGEF
jgi:Flp pilus assembly protein TadG